MSLLLSLSDVSVPLGNLELGYFGAALHKIVIVIIIIIIIFTRSAFSLEYFISIYNY